MTKVWTVVLAVLGTTPSYKTRWASLMPLWMQTAQEQVRQLLLNQRREEERRGKSKSERERRGETKGELARNLEGTNIC